jgi:hypothetical protein
MAQIARTGRSIAALALVTAAFSLAQAQSPSPSGDQKRPSGIYLESSADASKDATRLDASMPQIQTQGVGAAMMSMGFKKPKMVSTLGGDKAALRVAAQPSFQFVFAVSTSQRQMMEDPMGAMSQLSANTNIKDYALLRLNVAEGDRVYNSGDQHVIKCSVENVAPHVFRVKPNSPLEPGEYGFTYLQNGTAGMIWDFGVDGPTTK